jgi:hypothetical protein
MADGVTTASQPWKRLPLWACAAFTASVLFVEGYEVFVWGAKHAYTKPIAVLLAFPIAWLIMHRVLEQDVVSPVRLVGRTLRVLSLLALVQLAASFLAMWRVYHDPSNIADQWFMAPLYFTIEAFYCVAAASVLRLAAWALEGVERARARRASTAGAAIEGAAPAA